MPNTTTIAPVPPLDAYGVPLYQPNDPYHFDFDNKPIKTLAMRDQILAAQINQNTQILRDSAGDSGNLSSRLDKSIDKDGDLKKESVDQSMHNIAFHSDGTRTVTQREIDEYNSLGYQLSSQPEYVVMLRAERDKLSQITADANNITFQFPGVTNPVDDGTIEFQNSHGIYWEISNPGNKNIVVKPVLTNVTDHRHFYEVTPVLINGQYKISGIQSFKKDTLRVYVNGIRIPSCSQSCSYSDGVYFPSFDTATTTQPPQLKSPNSLWKNLYFTEINEEAKFTLSSTISSYDKIFVDYEIEVIQSTPTTTSAPTTTTTTTTTTFAPFEPENIFVSDSTGSYPSLTNATMSNGRIEIVSDGDPYPALAGDPLVNNGSSPRTFPGSSNNITDQAYNFLFTYRGGLNTNNPQDTDLGAMGVAINGVAFLNPSVGTGALPGETDLPSTGYHFNAVLNKSLFNVDDCGANPDANGVYGYRDGSFLANCWATNKLYGKNTYYSDSAYLGDHFRHTDGHSKIVGFCFDGYPIYGPYGYTNSISSTGGISQMLSLYTTATTEKSGRGYDYDDYPAGSFIEDYNYNGSLADYMPNPYLDENNGRYCVTPEYPNGTYAYFLTFVSGDLNTPAYPYVFGPKTKQIREAGGAQNQGSGAYTFYINITSISNTSYALNGKDRNGNLTGNNLSINVKVGDALIFNVSSSGQPLWLKEYDVTGAGSSLVGVNNNGTENGTVAWVPDSPGVYYYISENSFNMHGSIVVVS